MINNQSVEYFLGANAPSGFYSLYSQLLPSETANAIYILKGGPGCGKSTLMRKVAHLAEDAGQPVEYILCSGDPQSLDAIILPQLSAAIVDGTAPHVVEPKYPGAVESYVNLGDCYDKVALGNIRSEIIGCMSGYKGQYQRAYRCLGAAAEILEDVRATLDSDSLEEKLARRAKGILSREVHPRRGVEPGHVTQRFISAVTHMGQICLWNTVLTQCQRVYELSDRYGLAHRLLTHLLAGAVQNGYDVIACPNPMAPDRLAHLIIPQLSLAFVSSSPAQPFPGEPYRRIRLDNAAEQELLRRSRPRLRFSLKVSAALMDEAVESLAQAKAMHDDLEALYNPFVDFDRVHETACSITDELLLR